MKHTLTRTDGRRVAVDILFTAHQLGVHRGVTDSTQAGYVVTDLTTGHMFTRAGGTPLVFATVAQACAFVGVLLITPHGFTLANALAAIENGGQE